MVTADDAGPPGWPQVSALQCLPLRDGKQAQQDTEKRPFPDASDLVLVLVTSMCVPLEVLLSTLLLHEGVMQVQHALCAANIAPFHQP